MASVVYEQNPAFWVCQTLLNQFIQLFLKLSAGYGKNSLLIIAWHYDIQYWFLHPALLLDFLICSLH